MMDVYVYPQEDEYLKANYPQLWESLQSGCKPRFEGHPYITYQVGYRTHKTVLNIISENKEKIW